MAPTLDDARAIIREVRKAHPTLSIPAEIQVEWSPRMTRAAGKAVYATNTIRLSASIFSNPANFHGFRNTVLHELAHLIVGPDWRRGDADLNDFVWSGRQGYRPRRGNPHGSRWQRVHRQIGGTAERCHQFEVKRTRRANGGDVICERCTEVMYVGPKVYANIRAGRIYGHRLCGGRLSA